MLYNAKCITKRSAVVNLYSVIWKEKFIEKLALKHGGEIEEVEDDKQKETR